MPRYFFHVRQGRHLEADETGVDLPDLRMVRAEAMRAIADAVRDVALSGEHLSGEAFEIVDDQGRLQLTVPFDVMTSQSHPGE